MAHGSCVQKTMLKTCTKKIFCIGLGASYAVFKKQADGKNRQFFNVSGKAGVLIGLDGLSELLFKQYSIQ